MYDLILVGSGGWNDVILNKMFCKSKLPFIIVIIRFHSTHYSHVILSSAEWISKFTNRVVSCVYSYWIHCSEEDANVHVRWLFPKRKKIGPAGQYCRTPPADNQFVHLLGRVYNNSLHVHHVCKVCLKLSCLVYTSSVLAKTNTNGLGLPRLFHKLFWWLIS